ncbi:hypothetical protein FLA_5025 [Filimonas lacunae]|nr:hypothetical protein FLA_5025 [Filimonas lacunae]
MSFGLMSFALPGNHFTHKSIWGIDHLSLEPDSSALSGYSSDGFLIGHLLDMLAGIEDGDSQKDEPPAKQFNYHYSYFNLHKTGQESTIDKRVNQDYLFIPEFCLCAVKTILPVGNKFPALPSYYAFLFRLTPF